MSAVSKQTFIQKESEFKGRFQKSVYQTAFECYRPYAFRIFRVLILGFIGRFTILANANVIGRWVDHFQTASHLQYLTILSVLTAVGFTFTLLFRMGLSRLSCYAVSQLYDEVTARVSRYPMSYFDTTPAGRIMTRFTSDYGNVFRLFGGPLAELFSLVFDLFAMVVLASLANPHFIILCVVVGVINFIIYKLNQKAMRHERRELARVRSPSVAHFAETVQGAAAIRTFLREGVFKRRFRAHYNTFLNQRIRTSAFIFSFAFQISVTTALLLLMTGIYGHKLIESGSLTVGELGVAFGFITLSGNTIQNLFEWISNFEEAFVGLERLDQYLRQPIEKGTPLPTWVQFQSQHEKLKIKTDPFVWPEQATLEVKDLWLRYNSNLPYVLKGISFDVKAGEKIGVIGRTGSGKSSLVQSLFHLYDIDRGRVQINGYHAQLGDQPTMDSLPLSEFRKAMGVISQDLFLFQGPLRDNLTIDPSVTDEDIVRSLERVGLWAWFKDLPGGLDWMIEEKGRNLSQGERQMISLARCLLQQAPIIIMDEATASIDPQTEELMVQATEKYFKDRSQIIIAHRLSTLRKCDRILWLHHGEVRALDSPARVIQGFKEELT